MISNANNRDKLRKKAINRANREKDVNVLKMFINDFLNDVVTFLKSSNEVVLMLKLKT